MINIYNMFEEHKAVSMASKSSKLRTKGEVLALLKQKEHVKLLVTPDKIKAALKIYRKYKKYQNIKLIKKQLSVEFINHVKNSPSLKVSDLAYFSKFYVIDKDMEFLKTLLMKLNAYIQNAKEFSEVDQYCTLPKYIAIAFFNYDQMKTLGDDNFVEFCKLCNKIISNSKFALITIGNISILGETLFSNKLYDNLKIYKLASKAVLFKTMKYYSVNSNPKIPLEYLILFTILSLSSDNIKIIDQSVLSRIYQFDSKKIEKIPHNAAQLLLQNLLQICEFNASNTSFISMKLLLPFHDILITEADCLKTTNYYNSKNLLSSLINIELNNKTSISVSFFKELIIKATIESIVMLSDHKIQVYGVCEILYSMFDYFQKQYNAKKQISGIMVALAFQTKLQPILQDYIFRVLPNACNKATYLYFALMKKILLLADDDDLLQENNPYIQYSFPKGDNLQILCKYIENLAIDAITKKYECPGKWEKQLVKICGLLYNKERRCHIFNKNFWVVPSIKPQLSKGFVPDYLKCLLSSLPFITNFEDRLKLFYAMIKEDKEGYEGELSSPIVIRRKSIFFDGMHYILSLGPNFKGRCNINFIAEDGNLEEGIGYGVFKEYLTQVSKIAFDPHYGYFSGTEERTLMPNSDLDVIDDPISAFTFIGMLVGKAIYENILINPIFSRCFLNLILGKENTINDLRFIDQQLYKSVIYLKYHDAGNLGLTFTANKTKNKQPTDVPLLVGGEKINVTKYYIN